MKKRVWIVVFIVVTAYHCFADDYIGYSDREIFKELQKRDKTVKDLRSQVKVAKGHLEISIKTSKRLGAERNKMLKQGLKQQERIEKARDLIKELKTPPELRGVTKGFKYPLRPGDKAYISHDNTFNVFQINGSESMLIEFQIYGTSKIQMALLKGVSTNMLADKERGYISYPVKCTGNTTYSTAAGSTNTVYVLEPVKIDNVYIDTTANKFQQLSASEKLAIKKQYASPNATIWQSNQIELVRICRDAGMVKRVSEYNEVFVEPEIWNVLDKKKKEIVAEAFAVFCEGTSIFGKWCEIKSEVTEQTIAKYSVWKFTEQKQTRY